MQPLGCMRASKDERSRPCLSHLAARWGAPSFEARARRQCALAPQDDGQMFIAAGWFWLERAL